MYSQCIQLYLYLASTQVNWQEKNWTGKKYIGQLCSAHKSLNVITHQINRCDFNHRVIIVDFNTKLFYCEAIKRKINTKLVLRYLHDTKRTIYSAPEPGVARWQNVSNPPLPPTALEKLVIRKILRNFGNEFYLQCTLGQFYAVFWNNWSSNKLINLQFVTDEADTEIFERSF